MTRSSIVAGVAVAAAVATIGLPVGTAFQPQGSSATALPGERRSPTSEFTVVETSIRELQESMRAGGTAIASLGMTPGALAPSRSTTLQP